MVEGKYVIYGVIAFNLFKNHKISAIFHATCRNILKYLHATSPFQGIF
jgi:hypothetical protein